ncbi:hypothetical protein Afil01_33280 [Actinorhabdospora filicis]|uniref:SWIM-type domain-containing protein n=1 Tax=Actinorhabdospora filicis TaxID=1785913 RepID=A0A9W6SPT3_9ACTN|nr:hypothetical protein [Actinorhabdospora filicis]GLZ78521.1 hypothetical protein Afil01_33280 [Actinorhabdospora filicis]
MTWWSKRWPRALEALGLSYPDNRLVRARALIRGGAVDDLLVSPGEITAWVDYPRKTFGVSLRVPVLDEAAWAAESGRIAARVGSLAALLDDRLPEDMLSLFPGEGELAVECPCGRGLCVHVVVVHLAFADLFEEDPFLLPLLRGRGREELLAGVRAAMPPVPEAGPPVGVAVGDVDVAGFFDGDREGLSAW